MAATIEPEPTEEEREAILAALARPASADDGWASAALAAGVGTRLRQVGAANAARYGGVGPVAQAVAWRLWHQSPNAAQAFR